MASKRADWKYVGGQPFGQSREQGLETIERLRAAYPGVQFRFGRGTSTLGWLVQERVERTAK